MSNESNLFRHGEFCRVDLNARDPDAARAFYAGLFGWTGEFAGRAGDAGPYERFFLDGLLVAGMSPGAALVFLLAGPATNIGTLGILRKHFGSRLIGVYLVTVIACALVAGISLDLLWGVFDWSLPSSAAADHAMEANGVGLAALAVLAAVTIHAYWRRRQARQVPEEGACGCSQDGDGPR